ncbi:YceI family protein [Blastococcus sp. PRF04-17]|uniref:YceI family protein n=1 Tax=Blastococcus sp. PRF04-17 TaxID=2933797 RepID=UPI001FF63DA4|nr:YceI family protein [Blastococcus sp. PRF04-17]UOY02063.1 YceI family protein [Blastococcus sp. PRF04-17]
MSAPLRAPVLAAGTWRVDDGRTRVAFAVRNFGFVVHGTVACAAGEVELDGAGRPVRARARLDLTSVATGIARRDLDLRKPSLLDIDRHPEMTWSAHRFTPAPDGGWRADGVLAVRGTSAPLTLVGTPEAAGQDGACIRVRATGELDRATVGIRVPSLVIGRRVVVTVDAWLSRS